MKKLVLISASVFFHDGSTLKNYHTGTANATSEYSDILFSLRQYNEIISCCIENKAYITGTYIARDEKKRLSNLCKIELETKTGFNKNMIVPFLNLSAVLAVWTTEDVEIIQGRQILELQEKTFVNGLLSFMGKTDEYPECS